MADRILLESSSTDGDLPEDGSRVLPTAGAAAGPASGTGSAFDASVSVKPKLGSVPAFVRQVAAGGGTGTAVSVTVSATTTVGNRMIAAINAGMTAGVGTVTDSKGNDWTRDIGLQSISTVHIFSALVATS